MKLSAKIASRIWIHGGNGWINLLEEVVKILKIANWKTKVVAQRNKNEYFS